MKKNLVYIVTAITIGICAIMAIVLNIWENLTVLTYIILTLLALLAIFWGVHLIILYVTDFKAELESDFKFFKAETINNSNISAEEFDNNLSEYKKMFNKKHLWQKLVKIFYIVLCFGIALLFIVGLFSS